MGCDNVWHVSTCIPESAGQKFSLHVRLQSRNCMLPFLRMHPPQIWIDHVDGTALLCQRNAKCRPLLVSTISGHGWVTWLSITKGHNGPWGLSIPQMSTTIRCQLVHTEPIDVAKEALHSQQRQAPGTSNLKRNFPETMDGEFEPEPCNVERPRCWWEVSQRREKVAFILAFMDYKLIRYKLSQQLKTNI